MMKDGDETLGKESLIEAFILTTINKWLAWVAAHDH